jgi:hypothetical protein
MRLSIVQSFAALFFMTALSLVLASTSSDGDEDKECEAPYLVNFTGSYPNNVTVKCAVEDMDLITKVIHLAVELDAIVS